MKALCVKQPWAYLIVTGQKPLENRKWITPHRGPLLIHASKSYDMEAQRWLADHGLSLILPFRLPQGCLVGCVDLVDVVSYSTSPWYDGSFGWIFANPRAFTPVIMRGNPGLFEVDFEVPHGK